MIATIDLEAILEETDELNRLILHSEEVKRYRMCKAEMEQDAEAQRLIRDFNRKKESFEDVERFGKYHPDYQRIRREVREMKRSLDMNEKVARFKDAENELAAMLAEISKIIAYSVSTTIKVPTGNPFFDEGAAGGCGSGGCSGRCANCGN